MFKEEERKEEERSKDLMLLGFERKANYSMLKPNLIFVGLLWRRRHVLYHTKKKIITKAKRSRPKTRQFRIERKQQ